MLDSIVQPWAQFGTSNSTEYFAAPVTFSRPSTRLGAGPTTFPISNQFVRRDRQIADAFAGSVKNCVRHCRRRAGDSDLADPARAKSRHMRIGLVDEIDVEFGRVRENRQVVFGQISVDDATEHLSGDGR